MIGITPPPLRVNAVNAIRNIVENPKGLRACGEHLLAEYALLSVSYADALYDHTNFVSSLFPFRVLFVFSLLGRTS